MGIKQKFAKRYADSYMKKYGDRITQTQGNVISIKVEEKSILWLFHKLKVTILVRPERSKSVVKCIFSKNKWFKKPAFITITQGNLVVIQGMKGKKGKEGREQIQVMNVRNLSTKKDLIPVEGKVQKVQKIQRIR